MVPLVVFFLFRLLVIRKGEWCVCKSLTRVTVVCGPGLQVNKVSLLNDAPLRLVCELFNHGGRSNLISDCSK